MSNEAIRNMLSQDDGETIHVGIFNTTYLLDQDVTDLKCCRDIREVDMPQALYWMLSYIYDANCYAQLLLGKLHAQSPRWDEHKKEWVKHQEARSEVGSLPGNPQEQASHWALVGQ
jgi:hypothetical protein